MLAKKLKAKFLKEHKETLREVLKKRNRVDIVADEGIELFLREEEKDYRENWDEWIGDGTKFNTEIFLYNIYCDYIEGH